MTDRQPPAFRKAPDRGLFRRTPPAIFPPILGLLGLGLAWRGGLEAAGIPGAAAEAGLGAAVLLFLFAALAYGVKLARRPAVVLEDLRILPGQAGLAALSMGFMLFCAIMVRYAPTFASWMIFSGLAVHLVLIVTLLRQWLSAPAEARGITPVWHLVLVGPILAPLSLIPLGYQGIAGAILYTAIPLAALIWGASLWQIVTRIPPAPLRPLLAIHLAPASLFATTAALLGLPVLAGVFMALTMVLLLALLLAGQWIASAGYSALWGAFTFPLAAAANALLVNGWLAVGLLVLAVATAVTLPVALRVMQAWARGGLAIATNAALA